MRAIKDPVKRALAARDAYTFHSKLASQMAQVRRKAVADLHRSGYTYQEIADAIGVSIQAVGALMSKAARPRSPRWWERVPDRVAAQAKTRTGRTPTKRGHRELGRRRRHREGDAREEVEERLHQSRTPDRR